MKSNRTASVVVAVGSRKGLLHHITIAWRKKKEEPVHLYFTIKYRYYKVFYIIITNLLDKSWQVASCQLELRLLRAMAHLLQVICISAIVSVVESCIHCPYRTIIETRMYFRSLRFRKINRD